MMQPAGTGTPLLEATRILPSAMVQVEMSRMSGGPSWTGTPAAIGLADSRRWLPPKGATREAPAAGVDEVERDLARARRLLGPVADPAQVPRVPQRDDRDTVSLAPGDAQPHRLLAHHLAEAALAVDDRQHLVLEDDPG